MFIFSEATLFKTIRVGSHGDIISHSGQDGGEIQMTNEGTDVTGGMSLKLRTAVTIATESMGKTHVFICMIGSKFATDVCIRSSNERVKSDDSGTEIIFTH